MRLIGIEEHFITPAVLDAWDAIGLGARDSGAVFHGGDVGRRLLNLAEERLALMDETGLDMQVLGRKTTASATLRAYKADLTHFAQRCAGACAEMKPRYGLARVMFDRPAQASLLQLEPCAPAW